MKEVLTTHDELNTLDERELIHQTQNGDTEAFNPIVRRYQHRIYDIIYKQVRHPETAEDLCQEVFLKAWQALPNFRGDAAFYSWLHRIAVNCSIDFLRRQKREIVFGFAELPESADDTLQMDWTQSSPDEILEKEEFRHLLSEGVRRLPPVQRRVFNLRHRDGLRIKEIASRLSKSEGTIKTHLYQAHRKLRDKLQPYLQDETLEWGRGT